MVHSFITLPGRVHLKRLLLAGVAWTCLCFLVVHVSKSDTSSSEKRPWEVHVLSHDVSNNRELLGQSTNIDYNNQLFPGITTAESRHQSMTGHVQSVKVDTRPALSETDLLKLLSSQVPSNLPLEYFAKIKKTLPTKAKTASSDPLKQCTLNFPNLYELDYNNVHWQRFMSSNGSTFYLYGAYYDDRWRGGPLPSVRILSMIDRVSPPPVACAFWFDNFKAPILSTATYIYGWYPKWGNYKDGLLQPYVISCKVPRIKGLKRGMSPASVSIIESKCDSTISNNLKVLNDRPLKKEKFAVCVKGLDFLSEDLSVRLVEWLELLKILGASKIFLYELEIHSNISKVLKYYQESGLVQLTPITLPGNQPNLPGFRHLYLKNKLTSKRQNEIIPYNDCLYRNLYTYEYLALLDIDEIIMPIEHSDWYSLMEEVQRISLAEKNYTRASYNVRNVYFLDDLMGPNILEQSPIGGNGENSQNIVDNGNSISNSDESNKSSHTGHEYGIPKYMHMLQHVYRSRNYTKPGQYVKCFHNTERVVTLHNHFPLNCFGSCTTYSINPSLAHLQHYRKDCVGPLRKSCNTEFRIHTMRDTTIWKYRDILISNTRNVLNALGFFT